MRLFANAHSSPNAALPDLRTHRCTNSCAYTPTDAAPYDESAHRDADGSADPRPHTIPKCGAESIADEASNVVKSAHTPADIDSF